MPYPIEFRLAVAADHAVTGSSRETAETFGCSESWVRRLVQRLRERGTLELAPPKRPDTSKLDEGDLDRLATLVRGRPDMTSASWPRGWGTRRACRRSGARR
ncbi:MAG: hypothetical protein QM770_02005 [Tepidisphaeraceae bacterium]